MEPGAKSPRAFTGKVESDAAVGAHPGPVFLSAARVADIGAVVFDGITSPARGMNLFELATHIAFEEVGHVGPPVGSSVSTGGRRSKAPSVRTRLWGR